LGRALGGLGAGVQPVQRALVVDGHERPLLPGRVLPEDLEEPSVTRAAVVGNHDAVRRLLLLADAHQTDLDCQQVLLFGERRSESRSTGRKARKATGQPTGKTALQSTLESARGLLRPARLALALLALGLGFAGQA